MMEKSRLIDLYRESCPILLLLLVSGTLQSTRRGSVAVGS